MLAIVLGFSGAAILVIALVHAWTTWGRDRWQAYSRRRRQPDKPSAGLGVPHRE